jgi:hypothetical protein
VLEIQKNKVEESITAPVLLIKADESEMFLLTVKYGVYPVALMGDVQVNGKVLF